MAKGYDSPALMQRVKGESAFKDTTVMQRAYQDIDDISTLAEYRKAMRHIATDIANGSLPLKTATSILATIKEIRNSLLSDLHIHAAAGQLLDPTGEQASWSVPQDAVEEESKAQKPTAIPKPRTAEQKQLDAEAYDLRKKQQLANLKARQESSNKKIGDQIRDLENEVGEGVGVGAEGEPITETVIGGNPVALTK